VLLIFEANDTCWLFVELYEPAHPHKYKTAKWQNSVIPNWPHLRDIARTSERYDCVEFSAVEGVHFVAPDSVTEGCHWAVLNSGTMLWHERYQDVDDGEEGSLSTLEPDAFAQNSDSDSHSDSHSGSESDKESGSESDPDSDSAEQATSHVVEADDYLNNLDWQWQN
jgi:hypothetical protein